MRNIQDVNISGKKTLIRVDFNVPLDESLNITDHTRIDAALETLKYAIENRAKLIIASHLGRPEGKPNPKFSLLPVANMLGKILGKNVVLAPDCIGPQVQSMVDKMQDSDILMLENLRFHKQEQENDEQFGKALAELCDVYINDAFAVCHRENASVAAITKFAKVSGAGFLLKKEINYLEKALSAPKRPFVAIIGGAKVSTKLKALENLIEKVDKILIGGAMANTFLKSQGINIGASKFEQDLVQVAGRIIEKAKTEGVEILLPVDVLSVTRLEDEDNAVIYKTEDIIDHAIITDIGPATASLYCKALKDAKTIIWNGPMGIFEKESFAKGTRKIAQEGLKDSLAMIIAGGGDTIAAIRLFGVQDSITYMSTGGGAFLCLLEGSRLVGVSSLEERK